LRGSKIEVFERSPRVAMNVAPPVARPPPQPSTGKVGMPLASRGWPAK
jgi:hypothetical protein